MAIGVGGKFFLLMVFFSLRVFAASIFPSLPHNLLSRPVQSPEAYMSTVTIFSFIKEIPIHTYRPIIIF
jgi:hypothetical protein